jgi:SAM-dependent methyltransferase
MTLREAWSGEVDPDDYEAHMASVGQAQANATLVLDLLEHAALPDGARILIAGAGTGQMFDFIPAATFSRFRLIGSDINVQFLERLRERVKCDTVVDDVEDSRLAPGFDAIILVLVLEHVDSRRALASLARLNPKRFLIVIQQNPAAMTSAVTPGREVRGTMRLFAETVSPRLVRFNEVSDALAALGFGLDYRLESEVADGKKMIGALWNSLRADSAFGGDLLR